MTYALSFLGTNGSAKSASNNATLASAGAVTYRWTIKGDKLVPADGVSAFVWEQTEASPAGWQIAMRLVRSGTTVTVYPFVSATSYTAMGTYQTTDIDTNAWYEFLWQWNDSATTHKRRTVLWRKGRTAPILDYSANTSAGALNTASGFGTVTINRSNFPGSNTQTDGTWDWIAVYTGSPYETYNAALGPPPTPTGTDSGILDCWLIEENTGTSTANAVSGHAAMTVTNGTWVAGYDPTAKQCVFTTQPAGACDGFALGTAPVVAIQDVAGVTDTSQTVTVTLSKYSYAGVLTGTLTQACVSGVADFSGHNITTTGQGDCVLTASTTGGILSGNSATFTVQAPVAEVFLYPYEIEAYQVGDTQKFQAECYAADGTTLITGRAVTFTSSNNTTFTRGTTTTATAIFTASVVGDVTVTASCDGVSSSPTTVHVLANDGEPIAPQTTRTYPMSDTVAGGRTVTCTTAAQWLSAMQTWQWGDTILVDPSVVLATTTALPITLSAPTAGSGWIIVKSSGTIPAEGTRVSASATLPTIRAAGGDPSGNTGALYFGPYTKRIRFVGIRFDADPSITTMTDGLVQVGGYSDTNPTIKSLPTDIVLDRCVITGDNNTSLNAKRGINANCRSFALVDSVVNGWRSPNFDSNAISGGVALGPHYVANCYLEGASECVTYAGPGAGGQIADTWAQDLTFVSNEITHRLAWRTDDVSGGVAGPSHTQTKNLFEIKHGRRGLVRGNYLHQTWYDAQSGWTFVFWSCSNSGGGTGAEIWCETRDWLVEKNYCPSVSGFAQLSSTSTGGSLAVPMTRIRIQHNVAQGLGTANTLDPEGNGFYGRILQLAPWNDPTQGKSHYWKIEHNSVLSAGNAIVLGTSSGTGFLGHTLKNNVMGGLGTGDGIHDPDGASTVVPVYCNGVAASFAGNVFPYDTNTYTGAGTNYKAANGGSPACADFTALGLVGGATSATSATATLADWGLAPASSFKGLATDGTDPGADVTVIATAIADALDGVRTIDSGTVTTPAAPSPVTTARASVVDLWRPTQHNREGLHVVIASSGLIGTGGIALSGASTVSLMIPVGRVMVTALSFALHSITASQGSGAITAIVNKVTAAGVVTPLTASTSIAGLSAGNTAMPVLTALFDGPANGSRIIDGTRGDYLRVDVTAVGSVTTQPQLQVVAELAVKQ